MTTSPRTPKRSRGGRKDEGRAGILGQIQNPLVFFGLALLIIEGIIGIVVKLSNLTPQYVFECILLMAGLFILVVGAVVWITIKWPTHLYQDITKIGEEVQDLASVIGSEGFRDVVVEIVEERLRSLPPASPTEPALGTDRAVEIVMPAPLQTEPASDAVPDQPPVPRKRAGRPRKSNP